jgi:2-methylisocitrate lyase-like PEP mutase family enzyme
VNGPDRQDPDNEFIPREVLFAATSEIVGSVEVPVTADILSGLGDTVEAVVRTVKEVIGLGAVGINIEDGSEDGGSHLVDVEFQTEKIRAVCKAAEDSGVPIAHRLSPPWPAGWLSTYPHRVGGGVTPAVLPHHRTYGSVYGGS